MTKSLTYNTAVQKQTKRIPEIQKSRKMKRNSCSELFREIQFQTYLRIYYICIFTDTEFRQAYFPGELVIV